MLEKTTTKCYTLPFKMQMDNLNSGGALKGSEGDKGCKGDERVEIKNEIVFQPISFFVFLAFWRLCVSFLLF